MLPGAETAPWRSSYRIKNATVRLDNGTDCGSRGRRGKRRESTVERAEKRTVHAQGYGGWFPQLFNPCTLEDKAEQALVVTLQRPR